MTNRSKWIIAVPFSLIVALVIPAIAVRDVLWWARTPAAALFACLSFGMWVAATGFVDVQRPRGEPDIANRLIALALILAVPIAAYDHARWLAASMPAWVGVIGIVISMMAIVLGMVTRAHLGRSYAPSPFRRTKDMLVESGPYRWIRHPLYAAALLWVIGWPLIMASVLAAAIALILVIPAILKRIQTEEAELLRQYGEQYEAYRGRTWRLIPFVY